MNRFVVVIALVVFCCMTFGAVYAENWIEDIQSFEKQDRENPQPKGGILFLGSSSIRMWDLKEFFPGLTALNRGFGGSQIEDSIHFMGRIVLPYAPKSIVFYAGDNDIAEGKSPKQVADDFKTFAAKVHKALPDCRILFVAIKPSIDRWNLVKEMREANRMIAKFIKTDKRLIYVDIDAPMIGKDGKPRKDLFLGDGLHLNKKGYELWTNIVTPLLKPKISIEK